MGKGDLRSRKGKIWRGTYGVTRPQRWKASAPRPAVKAAKVKTLKDLPKAVEEAVVNVAIPAEAATMENHVAADGSAEVKAAKKPAAKKPAAAKKAPAKKK